MLSAVLLTRCCTTALTLRVRRGEQRRQQRGGGVAYEQRWALLRLLAVPRRVLAWRAPLSTQQRVKQCERGMHVERARGAHAAQSSPRCFGGRGRGAAVLLQLCHARRREAARRVQVQHRPPRSCVRGRSREAQLCGRRVSRLRDRLMRRSARACVLPLDGGPDSSTNSPGRRPPHSSASMLVRSAQMPRRVSSASGGDAARLPGNARGRAGGQRHCCAGARVQLDAADEPQAGGGCSLLNQRFERLRRRQASGVRPKAGGAPG